MKKIGLIEKLDVKDWTANNYNTHIAQYLNK